MQHIDFNSLAYKYASYIINTYSVVMMTDNYANIVDEQIVGTDLINIYKIVDDRQYTKIIEILNDKIMDFQEKCIQAKEDLEEKLTCKCNICDLVQKTVKYSKPFFF